MTPKERDVYNAALDLLADLGREIIANKSSSASPDCSIAWSNSAPKTPGMYLNRNTGSVCIVRVPKSEPIGIVVQGSDFYDRVPVKDWTGEWYGPIPW